MPTIAEFASPGYQNINRLRLEHLASLGLDLGGKSVLEIGAGVGDLTGWWLQRGCQVEALEGRAACCQAFRHRWGRAAAIQQCDLDVPKRPYPSAQVVFAYGVLYHLSQPQAALRLWCQATEEMLLLSTCVAPDWDAERSRPGATNPVEENRDNPTASLHGCGCRPSRYWVWDRLCESMPYVYCPLTQPAHEEFPLDWNSKSTGGLTRAVFIASKRPLSNPLLLPMLPTRHEAMK